MITLTTGVPGAGKTLYAINWIKSRSEKEQRPVYYSGINVLDHSALPWVELDNPEKWYELPANSIVVIDEAQRIFRPRGNGAAVPRHVSELETHRHRGIDIVLITQHPMLIDSNIRRLVGQHFHVIRRFGGQRAVVHEFSACSEITRAAIMEAIRHEFSYPAESFAWYKSAEVHTHKRRIPMRVWFLWASPLLIAALIWFAWGKARGLMTSPGKLAPAEKVAGVAADGAASAAPSGLAGRGPITRTEYLAARVPRIANLAYTAPVYDELTKVTRVPVPSACVERGSECRCYTQDATPLEVDVSFCRDVVRRGFFVEFETSPRSAGGANGGAAAGTSGPPLQSGSVPAKAAAGASVKASPVPAKAALGAS